MIIHMDGKAEELLEFVRGMQFPIAGYTCTDDLDADREVEKLLTAAKERTGDDVNRRTIPVELYWIDAEELKAEALKRRMTVCELATNIITDWMKARK